METVLSEPSSFKITAEQNDRFLYPDRNETNGLCQLLWDSAIGLFTNLPLQIIHPRVVEAAQL